MALNDDLAQVGGIGQRARPYWDVPYMMAGYAPKQAGGEKVASAFDELAASVEHLEKARTVVESLASRLCGPVSARASGSGIGGEALAPDGGVLGDIGVKAASINSIAAAIIAAVERIERRL